MASRNRGTLMLETIRQDLQLAGRNLLRERGVSAVALASFALGIAANATVFSLVQAVEFPRLIYPDASRLVFIESRNARRNLSALPVSAPDALDLAEVTRTLGSTALTADHTSAVREAHTPVRWTGRHVASTFFDAMRVSASRGRVLRADDRADVVVIGDRLWRTELGGASTILGAVIHIGDESRTVVGIMPPRFDPDASFWTPLPAVLVGSPRDDRRYTMFARIAAGASLEDVAGELEGISRRLASTHPSTNDG